MNSWLLRASLLAAAVVCGGCGETREMVRVRERAEIIAEMRAVLTPEVQKALLDEARAWRLHRDPTAPVARRMFEFVILDDGSFVVAWPRRRIIGKGLRWIQCARLLVHPDVGPEGEPRGGRIEVQFFEYGGRGGGMWESPVPLGDVLKGEV